MLFASENCQGTPYLIDRKSFPGLGTSEFALERNLTTGEAFLYVPSSEVVPDLLFSSIRGMRADGSIFCGEYNPPLEGDGFPAEFAGDLSLIFPPPYDVIER